MLKQVRPHCFLTYNEATEVSLAENSFIALVLYY